MTSFAVNEESEVSKALKFAKNLCRSGYDYYFLGTNKHERWALVAGSNFLHYCAPTKRSRSKFSPEHLAFRDNGCFCKWVDPVKSSYDELKSFSVKFDFEAFCDQQY